ncbi:amino acid adenylation domain-containing protein [Streptomonospora salina]|uniref:Amino acid adenylation domain-containing protein n=1 Tax=Streptomonospora salina TaxID=104205 RepID=A0A841EAJ2_9ACTN|nr:amino acid adenylation domain-containing protein [Streptomonospora salina]MBB6000022.1 amino acid adenylation domain-containing protein [Streptomonospora salina]
MNPQLHEDTAGAEDPAEPEATHVVPTLVAAFARCAAQNSDRIAVVADDEELSYGQLDTWSAAVCTLLHERGVRPGDRVAVQLPAGATAIVSILAVLRAGGAYLPLAVRTPQARNESILRDSGAAALIGSAQSALDDGVALIGPDEIAELRDAKPSALPPTADLATPGTTAYVIYTSGTTGQPKGVPITHGAVMTLLNGAAGLFSFSVADRWLLFHSLSFDFSVWEMWGALTTGGALVVLPHSATRSPEETLQALEDEAISVLNQTPTAFASLSAAARQTGAKLPLLRYVFLAGEKLAPEVLRPWAEHHGLDRPALVNLYGITETAVHSVYRVMTGDDIAGTESVIGRPLPDVTHRVLTSDNQEARTDERGILWLAGPQLSEGYVNLPELTAERFRAMRGPDGEVRRYYRTGDVVSRRSDGTLVFYGREDTQIKLRGYRIELGDVESAVRSHEAVLDAVVWMHQYDMDDTRLVCAYATEDPAATVSRRALREHVASQLPSYMRPSGYHHLPEIPRTVNGKVDRNAAARIWKEEKETQK